MLSDGADLTGRDEPLAQALPATADVYDADDVIDEMLDDHLEIDPREMGDDRLPMHALKSRLDGLTEFCAAGFGAAFDASGRRLTIFRNRVARGYWVVKDDLIMWHPPTLAERMVVVATVEEALMQTLRMVLASLTATNGVRG